MKKLLVAAAISLAACTEASEEAAPKIVKAVEKMSGQVLYAPPNFALSTTRSSIAAGFRAEDASREALAAVVETSAERLELPLGRSPEDFTTAVNGREGVARLLAKIRENIPGVLPLASEVEGVDWTITPVASGTTRDVYGNVVVYGRYQLSYKPIYQLRSSTFFRYMAAVLLRRDWMDYPKNNDVYFAAGKNAVQFVIALSLHRESGYYTGRQDDHRVGLAFAVAPENKNAAEVWNLVDDLVTFKTLGHVKDELVEDGKTVEVPPQGAPVDVVVAVDKNPSMKLESAAVREFAAELALLLADEAPFDYHVAFLTQGSSDFVRLQDGSRYLSQASGDLEALAAKAMDTIFADVAGATPADPDLIRTAALATTAPAATGVNKAFFREGAPKLLVVLTDRDDKSPDLDGGPISDPDVYVSLYHPMLAAYERYFVAPARACTFTNADAGDAATQLNYLGSSKGATLVDMCFFSPATVAQEVYDWAEDAGSLFHFDAPPPFPFTLGVAVNGKKMKFNEPDGWVYDKLADRIEFRPAVTPRAGDVVTATYYRLAPFVTP